MSGFCVSFHPATSAFPLPYSTFQPQGCGGKEDRHPFVSWKVKMGEDKRNRYETSKGKVNTAIYIMFMPRDAFSTNVYLDVFGLIQNKLSVGSCAPDFAHVVDAAGWGKVFTAHTGNCWRAWPNGRVISKGWKDHSEQNSRANCPETRVLNINKNRRSQWRVFENISDWMKSCVVLPYKVILIFCPMGLAMTLPQMNASYLAKTPKTWRVSAIHLALKDCRYGRLFHPRRCLWSAMEKWKR